LGLCLRLMLVAALAVLLHCQTAHQVWSAAALGKDSIIITAWGNQGQTSLREHYIARCHILANDDLDCQKMQVEWPKGDPR
jgi:hypothetical protein